MHNIATIRENINPYLGAILDFIYPPHCVICSARMVSGSRLVCSDCWQQLPRIEPGLENELPPQSDFPIMRALSVWRYDDDVQKIIHELKYHGKKSLALPIGQEMVQLIASNKAYREADLITPVPLHKTRFRERGFNQSQLIAKAIAAELGKPVVADAIRRVRYTRPQSKLGAEERKQNVAGAFTIVDGERLGGKTIILVDDVFTTGSTLRACAQVLHAAKASKILVITAARAI